LYEGFLAEKVGCNDDDDDDDDNNNNNNNRSLKY